MHLFKYEAREYFFEIFRMLPVTGGALLLWGISRGTLLNDTPQNVVATPEIFKNNRTIETIAVKLVNNLQLNITT